MKLSGSGSFSKALKYSRKMSKAYDKPMWQYLLLLIIYAAVTLLLPLVTVYVIDTLVEVTNLTQFLMLALLFFVVNISKVLLRSIINIYTTKREFQYAKKLEQISMESFFEKKGEFYIKNKTGDIMEIIIQDNTEVASFTYQVYRTIADLVNSFAILAIMTYLQWDLVLILLIFIPVILLIQNKLEWKLDTYYTTMREEMACENSLTEEFVSNAALIASHGIKDKCRNKYRQMLKNLLEIYKKIITLSNISFSTMEGFLILSIAIAMAYEGYKIFMGISTIGILVAFIQYSDFLIEPGRTLAGLRVQGNKLMPSIKRIEKITDTDVICNSLETPTFNSFDIEFFDLGFSYPSGKKIFEHVRIKMESGKTHVIVGASGKGKTTMIHLITGLWDATNGFLTIGGHPISEISLDYLRKHISLVSQDNLFFNETIRDNLQEVKNQYTDDQLIDALKRAGMFKDIMEMPQKLDTQLGDRGRTLSGGQRQRLAIARALLKDAPIIIFDEPTSALDENTEQIIFDTIKTLKNKTVLVITHRNNFINIADYAYRITDRDIRPI